MTMGQRLLALRTQAGLSQEALAERLGVSRQSISKWETDASIPDLDKLVRLGEIFGVTLDELVKGGSPLSRKRLLRNRKTASAGSGSGAGHCSSPPEVSRYWCWGYARRISPAFSLPPLW